MEDSITSTYPGLSRQLRYNTRLSGIDVEFIHEAAWTVKQLLGGASVSTANASQANRLLDDILDRLTDVASDGPKTADTQSRVCCSTCSELPGQEYVECIQTCTEGC